MQFPAKVLLRVLATGGALLLVSASVTSAQSALTIYNQDFAVVREAISFSLTPGLNQVNFDRATRFVEPDSVILRDLTPGSAWLILDQAYRAETASPALMLKLNEGQTIDFLHTTPEGKERVIAGQIVRAPDAATGDEAIIKVDGQLRFSLPGQPLFPALADDTVLRPTLTWQVQAPTAQRVDAELAYITGQLSWQAAYNLIAPEKGDTLDIVGWVTLQNDSGQVFTDATIKLMAGEVNKLAPMAEARREMAASAGYFMDKLKPAAVTEKAFDEFHLYSLPRPITLHNRETKQVEFLRASGVQAQTLYRYNGADTARYGGWDDETIRNQPEYGVLCNKKVAVFREFKNTKENGLGLPLPQGRTRFYRQDDADKRVEFTGENLIEHTPEGETVRLYTGDAFDLVGERTRTDYRLSNGRDEMEEAFEIKVRNRKKEPVEIRVTERLYRGINWEITEKSTDFIKTDARNLEFRVLLQPDEEKIITYRVRYNWR
jgi:hypothetical protein